MDIPIYHVDCSKVIFGTLPGKKKDAKVYIESQIERHFDVPKNCYYHIYKISSSSFHYEIQEDPNSGSVLNALLEDLQEHSHKELMLLDTQGNQYRLYQRADGSLRTFFLSPDETNISPDDKRIKTLSGKSSKLIPYFSKGSLSLSISAFVFLISLAPVAILSSLDYTKRLVDEGYHHAVSTAPFGDILDPSFSPKTTNQPYTNVTTLSDGWQTLSDYFKEHPKVKIIEKLEFKDQQWTVK